MTKLSVPAIRALRKEHSLRQIVRHYEAKGHTVLEIRKVIEKCKKPMFRDLSKSMTDE